MLGRRWRKRANSMSSRARSRSPAGTFPAMASSISSSVSSSAARPRMVSSPGGSPRSFSGGVPDADADKYAAVAAYQLSVKAGNHRKHPTQ